MPVMTKTSISMIIWRIVNYLEGLMHIKKHRTEQEQGFPMIVLAELLILAAKIMLCPRMIWEYLIVYSTRA